MIISSMISTPFSFAKSLPALPDFGFADKAIDSLSTLSIRGGAVEAAAASAFDLNRAKIRLDGLSSYGVMSVLLLNCAFRLYTSVPKKITNEGEKDYNKVENAVTLAFLFFTILSIVLGIT